MRMCEQSSITHYAGQTSYCTKATQICNFHRVIYLPHRRHHKVLHLRLQWEHSFFSSQIAVSSPLGILTLKYTEDLFQLFLTLLARAPAVRNISRSSQYRIVMFKCALLIARWSIWQRLRLFLGRVMPLLQYRR